MNKEYNPDTWGNGHARMKANDRAKQFLPFAAVRGLPEAMARIEERVAAEQEQTANQHSEWHARRINMDE